MLLSRDVCRVVIRRPKDQAADVAGGHVVPISTGWVLACATREQLGANVWHGGEGKVEDEKCARLPHGLVLLIERTTLGFFSDKKLGVFVFPCTEPCN
jgi:hypothetical protein